MEIQHRVLVFQNNPYFEVLRKACDDLHIRYTFTPRGLNLTSLVFYIFDSDPNYDKVKPLIYRKGVQVQSGIHYSKKDLEESEWFHVLTSESQYPQGLENYLVETYDLTNWCKKCGVGVIQNRPFRLLRDFPHKRDLFYGLHWVFDEIFARLSVIPILEDNNITGVSYHHPVYHKTGKGIDNTVQLQVDSITQPGLLAGGSDFHEYSIDPNLWKAQTDHADYCSSCGRVKYKYPRMEVIQFKRAIFEDVPDILKSCEYFGYGASAYRLVLVSKRFYQVATENKLHGLLFRPIWLVS